MKTFFLSLLFTLMSSALIAQTPVALKLNLEKGKTYTLKCTSKQAMQQGVAGQSMVVNINTNRVTRLKMLGQENDVVELEIKFDTTETKISSAMYSKETNSSQPGKEPVERIMYKMGKYPLKAKFSTAGKFVGFSNLAEYKANVMLVIDSLPNSQKDDAKKQAETLLKESALKSIVEPFFSHLTDKPVKANDTWESSYITSANDMSFLVFNNYVLKGVENGQALLSGTSEMESMSSNNPMIKLDQPVKGNSTFDARVDLATGLLLTNTETNHLEGVLTVNNNGTNLKVDLKIDGQSETTLVK
ncbi:MAG: DUF6263 family protein [Bacteroidia bacterium]|nr:DUF6263 family protein [Bacteroidia bacterium]